MATRGVVRWYGTATKSEVRRRAQAAVEELAVAVREEAQANLVRNDQIDTRYLHDSLYVSTPRSVTAVPPAGRYHSRKSGRSVRREPVAPVEVEQGAAVGAAAAYAIYPEVRNSYLYRALLTVAERSDRAVTIRDA